MKVLKFGGSSVATPDRIKNLFNIITPRIRSGEKITIVFSAFGGVTDQLIEMASLAAQGKDSYIAILHQFKARHQDAARELLTESYDKVREELDDNHDELRDLLKGILLVREVSPRTLDYVLSFGERNSNFIISKFMIEQGINANYLDARKIIKTNKDFNAAKVNFELTNNKIQEYYAENSDKTHIVTGFIASDIGGLTTTLGRGGSDYTAAILASGLAAEVLEIWTDVDGVLTSDPRKVKKAFTIPNLSYSEAMEMSHFGAKVIYPPTIQPALTKGIPIYIKNTFNPSFEGTLISKESDDSFPSIIKGVSSLSDISMIKLQGSGMVGVAGISGRMFGALGNNKINIILITQASSEHSICIAVKQDQVQAAVEALAEEFEKEISQNTILTPVEESNLCVVTVVGEKMKSVPGVAGALFSAMGKNGINIVAIAQGSSELNISFVIEAYNETKALNVIHDAFYMSDVRSVNLFIVGAGLIGRELLKQIHEQKDELRLSKKVDLKVVGISNSKNMVFDPEGLDLDNWQEKLGIGEKADLDLFVKKMKEANLPNSIFIDNTANKSLPTYYEEILTSNISIATPNKVATSSSQATYDKLKKLASERNIHFRYETNVGAGLPVIVTIQNLVNSGDKILQIQAVVSGSLSYIFNNFDDKQTFSALVAEAREKGYTEPDPREDLSGQDVRRKMIILSRESGYSIEPEDVTIQPILPQEVMDADGVEMFFEALKGLDNDMAARASKAKSEHKVLRFIGVAENGKANISLQEVGEDSPFYALESSDNLFIIKTERYRERPLIIRGPGAGAQVTAGGVFADILMMV